MTLSPGRLPYASAVMEIAILLFDGVMALDAVGPYDVLSRIPGAHVRWPALEPGPKRTSEGSLALVASERLEQVTAPEVVVVPGGAGVTELLENERLLGWLRGVHERSRWTTSVCTGALLLGAAGILEGLEATTHWLVLEQLSDWGARPVERRVIEQGKVMTAAGVSAGIDMALMLVERLAGTGVAQAAQLAIEYDPEPPFDTGSPRKASPELVALVRRVMERKGSDQEPGEDD